MKLGRKGTPGLLGAGLAVAMGLAAGAAQAGSVFTPPKGCTTFLTVQMRGCLVSDHYTCSADKPGEKWRVDFSPDGPFFISKTDSEAQWIETFETDPSSHKLLEQPSPKPASFSQLLATGVNAYEFTTVDDNGEREVVTGTDKLTGKSETIDGVALKQTEFDTTARDGSGKVLWHSTGHEFVQPELRLFISGSGVWDGGKGPVNYDNRPVAFLKPGQAGFGSSSPIYDCDSIQSSYPLTAPLAHLLPVRQ